MESSGTGRTAGRLDVHLLGPVELSVAGRTVPLGPPQQRLVLAALAVDAGRPVLTETLVDRVWDEAPDGARRTVHVLISRIRRLLAEAGATEPATVSRRSGGYVLAVSPDQVDLHRFRAAVEHARAQGIPAPERLDRLRAAVQLWGGEPLAGLGGHWATAARQAWLQDYLELLGAWAVAELADGEAAPVVRRLTAALTEHPLAEPLVATLVEALAGTGRAAEALTLYEAFRRRLADELGTVPGPRLDELHRSVLRGDLPRLGRPPQPISVTPGQDQLPRPGRAPRSAPAELPPVVSSFVGRQAELDALEGMYARASRTPVLLVSGPPGVGKTALALRWAHGVDHFPDGQLFVDLRGYSPHAPLEPAEALGRLIRGLGTGTRLPISLEERTALFRSLIADRRLLVVLDNAGTAEQVRPLLPGAAGCCVVVTSRNRLGGLVARDGGLRLDLDVLPADEALALFRHVAADLAGDRSDEDLAAAARVVELCGGLPLAIRVAAEMVASRRVASARDLAAGLADRSRRAELLDAGDELTHVAAVFSWSYRLLDPLCANTFRLLCEHPGSTADTPAVAAMTGRTPADTLRCLDRLARDHLIEPVPPDRWTVHDLLRSYGLGLARAERDHDRRQARERLLTHLIGRTAAASRLLYPFDAPSPALPDQSPTPEFTDETAARGWLETERPALIQLVTQAADDGRHHEAVALAAALRRHLDAGGHTAGALTVHAAAIRAARASGDRRAEATAHNQLGWVHDGLGRWDDAEDCYRRALALFEDLGDPVGQARSLGNLGGVNWDRGGYDTALDQYRQALDRYQAADDAAGQARTLGNLGNVLDTIGRTEEAVEHFRQAFVLFRAQGDLLDVGITLNNLGRIARRRQRFDEAEQYLRSAVETARRIGHRANEAEALTSLGELALDREDPGTARTLFGQVLDIAADLHHQRLLATAHNGLGSARHRLGDAPGAGAEYQRALDVASAIGGRRQQAEAHRGLASVAEDLGRHELAQQHWRSALAHYVDLDAAEAEEIRARLGE